MSTYNTDELRDATEKYEDNPAAKIPCPACHHPKSLTRPEDPPDIVAFLCHLCDGSRYVTKARALAVLPHIAQYVKELRASGDRGVGEKKCQKV